MITPYPWGEHQIQFDSSVQSVVKAYERIYPIKSIVPVRHPILTRLDGDYAIEYMLPNWWDTLLSDSKVPFYNRLILSTITGEEYREGNVNRDRLKSLRATLDNDTKKSIPSSTSIAKWLDFPSTRTSYKSAFESRGATSSYVLRITSCPEDMFFMSNGAGWGSCQHYNNGEYRESLRGAIHEHNLAMAVLIAPENNIQHVSGRESGNLIARVLLRVVHQVGDINPIVMVDKSYGQDSGTTATMLKRLQKVFSDENIEYCSGYTTLAGFSYIHAVESPILTRPASYSRGSYNDCLSTGNSNIVGDLEYYRLYGSASFSS